MISYGKQSISNDDIFAVTETLKSDFLTQGPKVAQFEKDLADYCRAKYCVAVSNGTAALQLAVAALDLPANAHGITSPNTFVATSNAMLYSGIQPIFADIDLETYNISTTSIKSRMTPETRLIMPVHFAGQACEMVKIKQIADSSNWKIIEDAAHAIGSEYADGTRVGNCKYSDMTVFSFHPVKTITTGEGGAITTNSEELYNQLCFLRSHGITKDPRFLSKQEGPWYYEMQELGFNCRMTDIQAALGSSQLKRLTHFKNRRREIVNRYNQVFKDIPGVVPPFELVPDGSCFHLYVLLLDFVKLGFNRQQFMKYLFSKDIGTQVHYIPVNTQPFYKTKIGTHKDDCPVAWDYYQRALSLPLYPDLSYEDQSKVIEAVLRWIKK